MINHFVIPVKENPTARADLCPAVLYDVPLQNSSNTSISTTALEGFTPSRRHLKVVNDCKMLYHRFISPVFPQSYWTKMWADFVFLSFSFRNLLQSFDMNPLQWLQSFDPDSFSTAHPPPVYTLWRIETPLQSCR